MIYISEFEDKSFSVLEYEKGGMQTLLIDTYNGILNVLKKYMDMDEKYYPVVAVWILATYFHESFVSFPYLFINAVKRSGKTRLLKLLSLLARKGIYTAILTEAVLFRLPTIEHCSMFIDEAEHIKSKEKRDLRLLLNSAYKRGLTIYRMRRNPATQKYEKEEFHVFTPIAIANIEGVDDVLEDRCLSIILERSYDPKVTAQLEYFEYDPDIKLLRDNLANLVTIVTINREKHIGGYVVDNLILDTLNIYNTYIQINYVTNITNITNITNVTNVTNQEIIKNDMELLIEESFKSKILGRDLELWFPLLITAKLIDNNLPFQLLEIAKEMTKERAEEDILESADSDVIMFIYQYLLNNGSSNFISLMDVTRDYKEKIDKDSKWFNPRYLSKMIKRTRIAKQKRKLSKGVEVLFNFEKIEKKLKQMGVDINKMKEEMQITLNDIPDEKELKEVIGDYLE